MGHLRKVFGRQYVESDKNGQNFRNWVFSEHKFLKSKRKFFYFRTNVADFDFLSYVQRRNLDDFPAKC